jgi:hypothetical protein
VRFSITTSASTRSDPQIQAGRIEHLPAIKTASAQLDKEGGSMIKGLRFHKAIKITPGIQLNISKTGIGWSIGTRGAHIGIDARGRKYSNFGLPGTGLSVRRISGKAQPGLFETFLNWLGKLF